MLYFFFQAEDGIRDGTVTGVQTCALPILHSLVSPSPSANPSDAAGRINVECGADWVSAWVMVPFPCSMMHRNGERLPVCSARPQQTQVDYLTYAPVQKSARTPRGGRSAAASNPK